MNNYTPAEIIRAAARGVETLAGRNWMFTDYASCFFGTMTRCVISDLSFPALMHLNDYPKYHSTQIRSYGRRAEIFGLTKTELFRFEKAIFDFQNGDLSTLYEMCKLPYNRHSDGEIYVTKENYVEVLPDLLRLADEIEEMQKSKAA